MARVALKHIGAGPIVAAWETLLGERVHVEDAAGRSVYGSAVAGARFVVVHDSRPIGWVTGPARAEGIARVLQLLVDREAERKSLGTEVLHLYREVNLIYSFSEKLAALLDLERVAELTLQQARHLIVATDGALMLIDDDQTLRTVRAFGDALSTLPAITVGAGIVGAVAESGVGEIVDDVALDPRRVTAGDVRSLVCAPLKVGEKVIGVIVLASSEPITYEARELKLLNTLALQTATAIENARLFERTVQAAEERERLLALKKEAEVARAGFERELLLAASIQAELFPACLPRLPGYDLAARNRPARQCGGDYYDALVSGLDGRVLCCVADVSGKGLPASLLMSHMQATLRALLGRSPSLTDLTSNASDLLHGSTAPNKYVTAALVEFDPASGRGVYVSAGHINSLLMRRDGDVTLLGSTGAPLGLLPPGLGYRDTLLHLDPGDCLVLCSDGVTDAQDEEGTEFGEERLVEVLRACRDQAADDIVTRVIDAVDAFVGNTPQFDDITLLVLTRDTARISR